MLAKSLEKMDRKEIETLLELSLSNHKTLLQQLQLNSNSCSI